MNRGRRRSGGDNQTVIFINGKDIRTMIGWAVVAKSRRGGGVFKEGDGGGIRGPKEHRRVNSSSSTITRGITDMDKKTLERRCDSEVIQREKGSYYRNFRPAKGGSYKSGSTRNEGGECRGGAFF